MRPATAWRKGVRAKRRGLFCRGARAQLCVTMMRLPLSVLSLLLNWMATLEKRKYGLRYQFLKAKFVICLIRSLGGEISVNGPSAIVALLREDANILAVSS